MNFESIIGEEVKNVSIIIYDDISYPISIEKILIETANNKILLAVDEDFDEIIIKIDNSLELGNPETNQHIIHVNAEADFDLYNSIGKEIIWTWTLNNNRGYDDAFQMEVADDNKRFIYQFLVIASRIQVYRLKELLIQR